MHTGLRPNEICHNVNEPKLAARFYCIITAKGRSPRIVYGPTMEECALAVAKKREELGIKQVEAWLTQAEKQRLRAKLQYYEIHRPSVVAYVARELAEPGHWTAEEGFSGEKVVENSEAGVLYWAAGMGDKRELTPHVLKKPRMDAVNLVLEIMLALYNTKRKGMGYVARRLELAQLFGRRPADWSNAVMPEEPWMQAEEEG
ncbi:hypothetical protein [Caudoviricetes sp.]|nr:hypothetical protein [Caudoviricetes sp.]